MRVAGTDFRVIFPGSRVDYRVCYSSRLHPAPYGAREPGDTDIDRDNTAPLLNLKEHIVHFCRAVRVVAFQFRDGDDGSDQLFIPFEYGTHPYISLPVVNPCPRIEDDCDVNPLRCTRIREGPGTGRNPTGGVSGVPGSGT